MKERKINIEFMRIMAIFFTVVIHVSNIFIRSYGKISNMSFLVADFFNAVARVCVPIFFMISGALLIKGEYVKDKYLKRIKKFIIILVVWSIIYYVVGVVRGGDNNIIKGIVYSFFNTEYTSKHLWFMYAIIGLYIALPFVQRMCKDMTREEENLFLILFLLICGLSGIYVPLATAITRHNLEVIYPVPLINSAYYLGYFICGHILYERLKNVRNNKKYNLYCILTYIVTVLLMTIITYVLSTKANRLVTTAFWYRGILIILESFSLFILIIINEDKFKSLFINKIASLSFGIYLIHAIFLFIIKDNYDIVSYPAIIMVPILSLIIYLCSLGSSYILKKIPVVKELL